MKYCENFRAGQLPRLAAAAALLAVSGCAGTFEGRVTDAHGTPMDSAVVVITWWENVGIVDGAQRCDHVETVTTGRDGVFKLPDHSASTLSWNRNWWKLRIFKPGYAPAALEKRGNQPGAAPEVVLPPAASGEARLNELAAASIDLRDCGKSDGSNRYLYKFHKQIADEAATVENHSRSGRIDLLFGLPSMDLIDFTKKTKFVEREGKRMLVNEDPADGFNAEELAK